MHIGTPLQEIEGLIYDTGSGKLLVESSMCSFCNGLVLEIDDSSSFELSDPQLVDTITYLDGTSLEGIVAYDRVCPTSFEVSCADEFEFIAITVQNGLRTFEDGIVGIWRGDLDNISPQTEYVPWLYQSGAISQKAFSFYMTGLDDTSYIDFGTPDSSITGDDGTDVLWLPVDDDSVWWQNTVYGMKWGSNEINNGEYISFEEKSGITDTGSSCIVGPSQYVDYIYDTILL